MRGEGRIFKRGRIWWVAYFGPGAEGSIEIRESTKSESETVAKKILRSRTREVANHRGGVRAFGGPRAERITVDDLIDSLDGDYKRRGIKDRRGVMYHAKPVRKFFGRRRALSVTPDHIREFIELERTNGKANATINRRLAILSGAFSLAIKEERLSRAPHIPHLSEVGNARKGFFEAHEHELMLAHLPAPIDDIARFAYVCGWRRGECLRLRWENVDRAAKEVRLFDSKNSEGRMLPLDEEILGPLFDRLWTARQYETRTGPAISEFVFHRKGRPISATRFAESWIAARTAAGAEVNGKLFHDYRRTAARNMIRAGVPQVVAMEITGHRSDSMFRRYNIVSTEDKREALRNIAKFQKPAAKADESRK